MLNKMYGYFEEINGNKYLTLIPTNESKGRVKTYEELWIKIRDLIRSVHKKSDNYDEKFIKTNFDSDNELRLNKTIEIAVMVKVVRAMKITNIMHKFSQMNVYKIQKMSYKDSMDVSEGIDVNKTL